MTEKAVILISGGLDSTTVLAMASHKGLDCYGLSFDYGQRHATELDYALKNGRQWGLKDHLTMTLDMGAYGGSALTDKNIPVPEGDFSEGIPVTYVPARNTVFLAFALGYAEVIRARYIYIGVNAVDYSGYPDCRPEFIAAFQNMANTATRAGVEGDPIIVEAPLIHLTKAEIIRKGLALGVDYAQTVSCYQLDTSGDACGRCESCLIRQAAFSEVGVRDPTHYQA
ncbi:MAG: 7-cyano-7-deazaguanine synthase QueC [Gammaproteobacteria bacterium]|nr:7-cyano-7-deazaguanine synthase QueC [Gammaproteobacteria bacterium]